LALFERGVKKCEGRPPGGSERAGHVPAPNPLAPSRLVRAVTQRAPLGRTPRAVGKLAPGPDLNFGADKPPHD